MAANPAAGQPAFISWSSAGFGNDLLPLHSWDDTSVPVDRRGKKPMPPGWSELTITEEMLARWSRDRVNVGLRTRHFPALDIDVDERKVATALEAVAIRVLGDTPKRTRANSPRCALLYRLDGKPFSKVKIEFTLPDGEEAKVEVLADGQQIAVAGTHSTGAVLEWNATPQAQALAPLSLDWTKVLLEALRARLLELGCRIKSGGVVAHGPVAVFPSSGWEKDSALSELALGHLDADMPYDDWIRVGMALHAKDPNPGGPAFAAWDSWSSRSEGKYQGTRDLEHHWKSFTAGKGVNFGTLLAMAKVRPSDVRPPRLAAVPSPNEYPDPTPPPELAQEEAKGIPLIRASEATEKPVAWVVHNFLAKGELTDLSGDPGVGKGGITASWAAKVTRDDPTATVIFFATEDPLGRVKARLRAEGSDLERVWFLDITKPNANPILPGDAREVEELVRKHNAALLILDPALEFMQSDLDSHKQQDVAQFMGPLLGIAMRTGAALLTVRHLNKNAGASALYRASGSIGFTGKVRIALLASKDAETGARALAVTKNNLGRDKHTVTYEVISRNESSVIAWGETIATSADELVNQEPTKRRGPPPARLEAARDVLESILAKGPMRVEDVIRCAKPEGVSRATAYRAADALKVRVLTLEMKKAWALPEIGNLDKKNNPSGIET